MVSKMSSNSTTVTVLLVSLYLHYITLYLGIIIVFILVSIIVLVFIYCVSYVSVSLWPNIFLLLSDDLQDHYFHHCLFLEHIK